MGFPMFPGYFASAYPNWFYEPHGAKCVLTGVITLVVYHVYSWWLHKLEPTMLFLKQTVEFPGRCVFLGELFIITAFNKYEACLSQL